FEVEASRVYMKNDLEYTCTIKIYNDQQQLVRSIMDKVPANSNDYRVSSKILLPKGRYSAILVVTPFGEGAVSMDMELLFETANTTHTFPFHTSFEEDSKDISTAYSTTGRKS